MGILNANVKLKMEELAIQYEQISSRFQKVVTKMQKQTSNENDKIGDIIKKEIELRFTSDIELKKIIDLVFEGSSN